MKTHGLGLASVRFICGTQDIHKQLEKAVSDFHQTEDTILYASAFDANGAPLLAISSTTSFFSFLFILFIILPHASRFLIRVAGIFEALLTPDDAIFSDALNHASIIDGMRLSKSQKKVYAHMDMADLGIHPFA